MAPTAEAHSSLFRSSLFPCGLPQRRSPYARHRRRRPRRAQTQVQVHKVVRALAPGLRDRAHLPEVRRTSAKREGVAGRCGRPGVPWDHVPLRLLSLVKSEAIATKILTAVHLSANVPKLRPAHPSRPPRLDGDARGPEDHIN
jgi:hypothetical protein